ncbi:MAG: hypothetical protein DRP45_01525 [Candidatus Zixiibacteriota bacterium]|nr:MAG: hypothetical protein DRP45_01525 [candidate division Zixibacteria bacterium]
MSAERVARTPKPEVYHFDRVLIGYCLLTLLLIGLFGRPIGEYLDEIFFYSSMAALAVLIIRYIDYTKSRTHAFFRLLYPAVMATFFYQRTEGMMFLYFDRFFDWQLVTFEKMILGFNPTLYIDTHLLNVWINELLSLCYFSYYLMLPGFLIPVFLKKDYHVIRPLLTASLTTFFVSYLLFALYPVEGPRWHFALDYVNTIDGPVFREAVNYVIDNGAVRGGAMPSSHTGVAIVILMFCFKHYRKAGWFLLPFVTGLAIGTVWGRFHYISDVVVGGMIGILAVLLAWKYNECGIDDKATLDSSGKLSEQRVA